MSVLEGPRREVRHVAKDGSAYWVEFTGGRIVFGDGRTCGEDEVVHLPPCDPTKIICVHVNYISRYYEFDNTHTPPESPTCFQKPPTALNAHTGELIRPRGYKHVNYEGEMAVVFGKVTRNVSRDEAWDCIAGFAPSNDLDCHDFRCGYLIADLARHMTFLPGDILLTGTPANSRPLDVGDTIDVEVTGVGRLSSKVVETPPPRAALGFPASPGSDGVRRVALGNEERLPDKFKTA